MSAIPLEQEIEYPTSDGQPMAETPEHQQVMIDLILGLRRRYAEVPDVWVGGNFFLCYEEGNPNAHVSPDVMMVRGVPKKKKRPNYLLWQEKPPTLVVEVTSKSTRREDQGKKKDLYERIGVEEYVLFDVFGEYLRPRLQAYCREAGRYRSIPLEEDGSLLSRTTGLRLKPEGERLRLVDAVTGEPLLWPEEVEAAHVIAEMRAAEEAAARRAAEARAAEEAAARRAAEARVAEEEAARQAAEARLRALEEELNRFRKS
ncbi:MAG TPA: Uma2 family endonuclease [Thermoanaerobaculia bacterium]|jgi:Uma2 family endonuclease